MLSCNPRQKPSMGCRWSPHRAGKNCNRKRACQWASVDARVCSVDVTAIDDHHPCFPGGAHRGHHLRDIRLKPLGSKLRDGLMGTEMEKG